jgi:hypothetical protein
VVVEGVEVAIGDVVAEGEAVVLGDEGVLDK